MPNVLPDLAPPSLTIYRFGLCKRASAVAAAVVVSIMSRLCDNQINGWFALYGVGIVLLYFV